jgi:phosphatidylglycerol:prolipoprotein diacylglycerol transferase
MPYIHDIDPIALHLPFWPHGIHWYGITYLLAFGLAWWVGRRRVRAGYFPGVGEVAYGDLMFYGMLGVVLGGRIGYVLFYAFDDLLRDPLLLLRIKDGGMSFHGGLLGVMAALLWWSRAQGRHLFDTLDFVVPMIPIGLGLGRIGNFIGGELWGRPTDVSWAVIFPASLPAPFNSMGSDALHSAAASGALEGLARHPSQLYQAALEGLALGAILLLYSRSPRRRYAVSGLFALCYGLFRFAVEFVRQPDVQLGFLAFGWLTMGQLLSLPLIAVGLWLLWLSRRAPCLRQPA